MRSLTSKARLVAFLGLAAALLLPFLPGTESAALAHPLGNFTINQFSRLELTGRAVNLHYVVDMAEIPTFQEIETIDINGDGELTDSEQASYLSGLIPKLSAGLLLAANGESLPLAPVSQALSFPPGQAGLKLMRVEVDFIALLPEGGGLLDLTYEQTNYEGRLGWREIVVQPGPGAQILAGEALETSISDELRTYPQDSLSSPLDMRSATTTVETDPSAAPDPAQASGISTRVSEAGEGRTGSGFARLISAERLSTGVIVLSLLAAMGFGALHALGPGHGKTIVAAYLVGSRGTPRHALLLGATVTLTHTSSVFLLGVVTLWASQYIVPEQLYPWLTLASGVMVVVLGLSLLFARERKASLLRSWTAALFPRSGRGSGGHEPHHDGGQARHEHHGSQGQAHEHHHLPPERLGLRSLVALGVSGGILPCPTALVVMLGAISLHRVGFGMLLIVAFSLGLAGVLTGIGLALVLTRKVSARARFQERVAGIPLIGRRDLERVARQIVPVGSALAVTAAGLVLTVGAVSNPLFGL